MVNQPLRQHLILVKGVELVVEREQLADEADNPGRIGVDRRRLDRRGQRFLAAIRNRMLELVYLGFQRSALIGRRTAVSELDQCVERTDTSVFEIEFAL